ncbi:uncharacterized protein [Clytia hemisphaerica]|uniref:uncharacterized protein n=1 Tax=Clytia hemisphaerica TaxID=252671 RepID=UPI0034D3DECD|eukprot:TCONS_00001719-protein
MSKLLSTHTLVILALVSAQFTRSKRMEGQFLGLLTLTRCQPEQKKECQHALMNQESIIKADQQHHFWFKVNLCFKDMRNNSNTVTDTLLPLVVDESYSGIKCENKKGVYKQSGHMTLVFTYLSFDLTRLVSSMILPLNSFNLVSVTDQPMYPAYFLDHPLAIYSYESSFGVNMHTNFIKIKNKLNITYNAFFNLRDENQTSIRSTKELCANDPSASAMCIYRSLNPMDCYKELNIDVHDQNAINNALNLLTSYNLSFIVQAGDSTSIDTFLRKAGLQGQKMTKRLYLPFVTKTISSYDPNRDLSFMESTVLINFQGSGAVNHFFILSFNLPNILLQEFRIKRESTWVLFLKEKRFQNRLKNLFPCWQLRFLDMTYRCGNDITLTQFFRIPISFLKSGINRMLTEQGWVEFLIVFWKSIYYIANVTPENILRESQWSYNPSIALKARPYCDERKPLCQAGYELKHSFYEEKDWDQSYGWNCKLCPDKFYKPYQGNKQRCQECYYPNRVNSNNTLCYDPFIEATLNIKYSTTWIILAPSALLVIMTLLTMFVFLINRETPIVKLSNHKMTIIQLINHLLLFILPSFVFFHTTTLMCIGRQILLGLAFSITLSINISKSQKLYMIVGSKIKMSPVEILMTKASEWLIIVIAIIINTVLNILYFFNSKRVTIEAKYFDNLLTKELYCSNNIMIYIQLLFAAVLSLCSGIQGFRARKLPSRFQETNHVIYSSFISTVVFVAATGVYFSQQSMVNRSFIVLLVTTIYNAAHFILLYGYKTFIIIFRPQVNTREAFNKMRLQEMALKNNNFTS